MIKIRKLIGLLLAAALIVGLPYSVMSAKKPIEVQYVALGDSLAAGRTPDGIIDYGYPDYIKNNFQSKKYILMDYENFGIPGYTSMHLKNDLLNSYKIRKKVKKATHITIDIGANDFLSILRTNPDPAVALAAMEEFTSNLDTIFSTIDQINPKAKVYVMGYYNPFPYYKAERQETIKPLLATVNTQIEAAAKEHGDIFVPTEKVVATNYEKYMPNKEDIHLSKAGYQAVANEFWKKMNK